MAASAPVKSEKPAAKDGEKRRGRAPGSKVVPATVTLDYSATASPEALKAQAPARQSSWNKQLSQLKADTIAGKVPQGEDGKPQYVKVGVFAQPGSAQQTIKGFNDNPKKLPSGQWDFTKTIALRDGKTVSELWARWLGEVSA